MRRSKQKMLCTERCTYRDAHTHTHTYINSVLGAQLLAHWNARRAFQVHSTFLMHYVDWPHALTQWPLWTEEVNSVRQHDLRIKAINNTCINEIRQFSRLSLNMYIQVIIQVKVCLKRNKWPFINSYINPL